MASQCSGQHHPPILGDYEAQRHWQEITVNILIKVCNRIDVDVRCVNEFWCNRTGIITPLTMTSCCLYWGMDHKAAAG